MRGDDRFHASAGISVDHGGRGRHYFYIVRRHPGAAAYRVSRYGMVARQPDHGFYLPADPDELSWGTAAQTQASQGRRRELLRHAGEGMAGPAGSRPHQTRPSA